MTQVSPFSCGSDSIVVEKTIVTKEVSWGLPSRPLTQPRETNEVASLVKKAEKEEEELRMKWNGWSFHTMVHFENQKVWGKKFFPKKLKKIDEIAFSKLYWYLERPVITTNCILWHHFDSK